MKKIWIILISFSLFLLTTQFVMARSYSDDVVTNFVQSVVNKDEKQAKTYLSSNVKIPEIREMTLITSVTGLPSPKENVRVSIAYFDGGEGMPDRIAFIWEITTNKEKITDIRVVYDGSNPFMNESNVIKEYEGKNKVNILIASRFPFDITHIEGNVDKDILMLRYRNADLKRLLEIKVMPSDGELEIINSENDKLYTLENGIKALYKPDSSSTYQLIFQYNNFAYSLSLNHTAKEDFSVDDLLKVSNSMISN